MKTFKVAAIVGAMLVSSTASASEYCEKMFAKEVGQANGELGAIFEWQRSAQRTAENIVAAKASIDTAITNAANSSSMSDAAKLEMIKALSAQKSELQKQEQALVNENFEKNKRINALRGSVPQFQKKAEDCAREAAPANLVVNLVVQGLAAYITDGASLLLPNKKALYIDMGEILHGNIMGGDKSAPNQVKDWINGRLGTKF